MSSPRPKVILADLDPEHPDGPPVWRSLDSLIDELFPPGTPARAHHDQALARLRREGRIVRFLTGWLFRLPLLRWEYTDPKIRDGRVIRFYHGLGHIAGCFWADMAEGLLFRRRQHDSVRSWLGDTFYNALDGLAFHYFDDVYVPTIADVHSGVAGLRRASDRRRHAAAIETAIARAAEWSGAKEIPRISEGPIPDRSPQ